MQIVEAKNNLVKVNYNTSEESLTLSGFVVMKDAAQSFIGQIVHLEANSKGNFAIVKLLFNFDDNGVITNYNGSVPDSKSLLDVVYPQELLELLPIQNPIVVGELAQQKTVLTLDRTLFEKKLVICSEKEEDNEILINNFAKQLKTSGKKVLVIDLNGNLSAYSNKVVAGVDFKLPLNYNTINFIYEKGLDDAKVETKALIQEIFLEVQNYVKTLPDKFIPFETFKNVVDGQYEETDFIELVLLKNKLLKYYEEGIFAQKKSEFDSLKLSLQNPEVTVLDLSKIDEKIQREMISYAYSLIAELSEQLDEEIYVICNINDANSDKKLLKQIFTMKNAYSTLICPYSYKYLKEIKQLSKDLILFAPIQQQTDFAGYNVFLSKLNVHEFVIYGQSTHYLPLIVKLEELKEEAGNSEQEMEAKSEMQNAKGEEEAVQPFNPSTLQPSLDEEIKRDVDEIYTTPKSEQEISQGDNLNVADVPDELTEDDLDFIDDLVAGIDAEDEIENEEQEEISEDDKMHRGIEDELYSDASLPSDFQASGTPSTVKPFDLSTQKEDIVEEVQPELIEEELETEPEMAEEIGNGELEIEEDEITPSTIQPFNLSTDEEDVLGQQSEPEQEPPAVDILPVRMSSTPIVPIYSADVESNEEPDVFEQGDTVMHPKYGKGTVEKLINYGSKTLCSINFDNVGRRLLDPSLAEIKKV